MPDEDSDLRKSIRLLLIKLCLVDVPKTAPGITLKLQRSLFEYCIFYLQDANEPRPSELELCLKLFRSLEIMVIEAQNGGTGGIFEREQHFTEVIRHLGAGKKIQF